MKLNNKYLGWILFGLLALFVIGFYVISEYKESRQNTLEEQMILGKIEIIKNLTSRKVPLTYIYCPDINFTGEEESLRNQFELRNETNSSEEIQKQVDEVMKPKRGLCEERDLHFYLEQSILNINQMMDNQYNQALIDVEKRFDASLGDMRK